MQLIYWAVGADKMDQDLHETKKRNGKQEHALEKKPTDNFDRNNHKRRKENIVNKRMMKYKIETDAQEIEKHGKYIKICLKIFLQYKTPNSFPFR